MLSNEHLAHLSAQLLKNPSLRSQLHQHLLNLISEPAYRAWHDGMAQAQPYPLPSGCNRDLLEATGLCVDGKLQARVNLHGGLVFLTDGVWVPADVRVFPYHDESATLIEHLQKLQLSSWGNCVIDLAGGCGHTAWALPHRKRYSLDINPRALSYARLNKTLNGLEQAQLEVVHNDIRYGLPGLEVPDEVLVVGNLPFGPAPNAQALPLTSNGGHGGLDLQLSALRSLKDWPPARHSDIRVRAALLGLSVGEASAQRWVLEEQAQRLFGAGRVQWHVLDEQLLLRANGQRLMRNPAPVYEALPALSRCQLYTPDPRAREQNNTNYKLLAATHVEQGNPDISYGLLTVEVA